MALKSPKITKLEKYEESTERRASQRVSKIELGDEEGSIENTQAQLEMISEVQGRQDHTTVPTLYVIVQ